MTATDRIVELDDHRAIWENRRGRCRTCSYECITTCPRDMPRDGAECPCCERRTLETEPVTACEWCGCNEGERFIGHDGAVLCCDIEACIRRHEEAGR